ncbi:hypothetical protein Tco_1057469 [Tanacetum coccineum]|uniref:Uncharacterized protein n=1 Tax=Tanacetum coccineum TaxID=301880 RepID=A0ABQ5H796_9ASTR
MGIRIPQSDVPSSVADEAIIKEMHDGLVRATTTTSSLEAEQGSGNIAKTQTKATSSGLSSLRTSSEGGPGCHFTIGDIPVQARPEKVSNLPNEPPLKEAEHKMENEHDDDDRTLAETLLNIKRSSAKGKAIMYHAVQNRPFSKAEVRKNMYTYLKNQGGYKMSHFKGMSYEDIRPIFERVWDQNQAFVPKDSEIEKEVMKRLGFDLQQESSKKARGSKKKTLSRKRAGEKQSDQSVKRQKMKDDAEKEDFKEYPNIVPKEGMNVEALQTKYPLIDWEIYTEDSRVYWKIIRVWKLVKDKFSSTEPNDEKEKTLWVELKRLFEPDTNDLLELERYMHDPLTWRLYATCGVHHVGVFLLKGLDMFMLFDKGRIVGIQSFYTQYR